jgi:hypothetical protein
MVRVLINDLLTPQKYTDSYLQQVLVTAGVLVDSEFDLPQDYTFGVSGITISPDPIATSDSIFQGLVPLKSACILNQGNFQTAVTQGIKVRDGDSAIDTTVGFRGYKDILEFGPCAIYDKLRWDIQSGKAAGKSAGEIGIAVISPYRAPNIQGISDVSVFFDRFASVINRSFRRY